jgi:hypothetical protein
MDKASQIRAELRKIVGADRPTFDFLPMEVKSVKGDLCVCLLDDLEIPDVRLVAIPDGSADGLLITPKAGSIVMVADLSTGTLRDLMVVQYTEIESVRFHQGGTTITADGQKVAIEVGASSVELTDGLIKFNDGSNNGLVIGQNTADKLNAIEQDLNALKSVFAGWVTVPQDGGAALKTAVSTWAGQQLTPTVAGDLENDKITH